MGHNPEKRYFGWLLHGLFMLVLLIPLAGCNTTSAELPVFKATGSWEGTVGSESVRALVAPDGAYRMAILDADGNVTGEYVGNLAVNQDNIGRGAVAVHRKGIAVDAGSLTFLLGSGQLSGSIKLNGEATSRPLQLHATADAQGPASQDDVGRRWSVTPGNFSDVVVTPGGEISATLGDNCAYSGRLELYSADWDIYRLQLDIATVRGMSNCQEAGHYTGLAMVMGDPAKLWFSGQDASRAAAIAGAWPATQNLAPLAVLAEVAHPVNALRGLTPVNLDGSASSDVNRDPLTYTWSGVAPDGSALSFTAPSAGKTTFIPAAGGDYAITLTVGDGLATTSVVTMVTVALIPARFIDNGNGTVTDGTTRLVWLKDAGCFPNLNVVEATAAIAVLEAPPGTPGPCGLNDGSRVNHWRLPSDVELTSLRDNRFSAPAISNALGVAPWSEGDAFVNVAPGGSFSYWTGTPASTPGDNVFVDFVSGTVAGTRFGGFPLNVWPVRDLRFDELPTAP